MQQVPRRPCVASSRRGAGPRGDVAGARRREFGVCLARGGAAAAAAPWPQGSLAAARTACLLEARPAEPLPVPPHLVGRPQVLIGLSPCCCRRRRRRRGRGKAPRARQFVRVHPHPPCPRRCLPFRSAGGPGAAWFGRRALPPCPLPASGSAVTYGFVSSAFGTARLRGAAAAGGSPKFLLLLGGKGKGLSGAVGAPAASSTTSAAAPPRRWGRVLAALRRQGRGGGQLPSVRVSVTGGENCQKYTRFVWKPCLFISCMYIYAYVPMCTWSIYSYTHRSTCRWNICSFEL